MRLLALFPLALVLGCPSSRAISDAGAAPDTATVDAARPVERHYHACARDADCPAGDLCGIWWRGTDPVSDPPPAMHCRPPCADVADCPTLGGGVPTCDGGRCALFCFPAGGIGPDCDDPFLCDTFYPSSHDGYCVAP